MKLIPNLLSAARLALAPYFFLLLVRHQYDVALGVCFLAGITDALDGLLARVLKASSKIGAYLDPTADKILLSGAFLTLALDHAMDRWIAVLVLGRDVMILLMAAAAFLFTTVRSFPPSFAGKASTTAQIIFIFVLLLWLCGWAEFQVLNLAKWIAVVLTVWSGLDYLLRGVRYIGIFQHTSQ